MKHLFDSGVINKIQFGVKILGQGAEKLTCLGKAITLEASDATQSAIDAIKATGGSVSTVYRTPMILRNYLKPHKYPEYKKELKTPMPHAKKVKQLERLRVKGMEVAYPAAPWITDNLEAIEQEKLDRQKRLDEA